MNFVLKCFAFRAVCLNVVGGVDFHVCSFPPYFPLLEK